MKDLFPRTYQNFFLIVFIFIASLMLSACGGGGGGGGAIPPGNSTASSDASDGGRVEPTEQTVANGNKAVFTLIPDTGYTIDTITGCGGELNGNIYTTDVLVNNCIFNASFKLQTLTVSIVAGDFATVSPASPQEVTYGDTTSFTVTPDTGYLIDTITGCDGELDGNIYTTGIVTENCAVTANIKLQTLTVSAASGGLAQISPNSSQLVTYGDSTSFTFTPNTGYVISNVTGCDGSLSGNTYTTGVITENCAVTANFELQILTVSATAGSLAVISPSSQRMVSYGSATSFTFAPITGYVIDTVTGCNGTLSGNTYTTGDITADCSVTASLILQTLTVNATAGGFATISPDSPQSISYGSTASFTFVPNTGYIINSVTGCGGVLTGNTYTTGEITVDCMVNASLSALSQVLPLYPNNGANWNDYVKGIGINNATDVACNANADIACLHGGERRVVEVTGWSSCAGLSATDTLGAFKWICDASSNPVRFISVGMADERHLSDLLNFSSLAWLSSAVIINNNDAVVGRTASTFWWGNPVISGTSLQGNIFQQGAIYVVTGLLQLSGEVRVAAPKVGIVIAPGSLVRHSGFGNVIFIDFGGDFAWLEGEIEGSITTDRGIEIGGASFTRLDNVTVVDATRAGIDIAGDKNTATNIVLRNNDDGINIKGNEETHLIELVVLLIINFLKKE